MLKNIIQSLLSKGLVAFLNLIILLVTSRYLGVSSRGEISIFILNVTIIQVINEVYTGYSLIHFIPKYNLKKLFITGCFYTIIFTSLSNTIVVFLEKQIPGYEWTGYLVSLLVIFNTFHCVLLLGKEKLALFNLLSFLQPFLLVCGLLFSIFVLKELTFKAYLFPLLFSFFIAFVISFYQVSKFVFKSPSKPLFEIKPILLNGMISQAAILTYFFCNRYSYYLLPSTAEVGLYSSASSLVESVLIVVNGIAPVLLARVANQDQPEKNLDLTLSLSKLSLVFSLLVVFIFYLIPEQFYILIFGNGFAGIKTLMMLYAPGMLMVSVFGIYNNYFSARGQMKVVLICNSLGFISTLILAPLLINKFGMKGAAYSSNLAYFLIAVSICAAFIRLNKLSFKRLFTLSDGYHFLIGLISRKQP